jgi:hypothetical protein
VAENAWAAAATRPTFTAGSAWSAFGAVAPDDAVLPERELLARWKPVASARDAAGFANARWAAVAAAAAAAGDTSGIDCVSVRSVAGVSAPAPTRVRSSGLDAKYLLRKTSALSVVRSERMTFIDSLVKEGEKRILFVFREVGKRHLF